MKTYTQEVDKCGECPSSSMNPGALFHCAKKAFRGLTMSADEYLDGPPPAWCPLPDVAPVPKKEKVCTACEFKEEDVATCSGVESERMALAEMWVCEKWKIDTDAPGAVQKKEEPDEKSKI